ncbi:hypothetical protein SAMN05414139_09926 [Burkholderia sp. D7]|nr:hypothetical protein SAMN05414139_09926 [Burkholderia sp. D7]
MVVRKSPESPSQASSHELAWVPQCPLTYLHGPDGPYNPEAIDGEKAAPPEDVRSRASATNQTAVVTKATTVVRYPGIFLMKSPALWSAVVVGTSTALVLFWAMAFTLANVTRSFADQTNMIFTPA